VPSLQPSLEDDAREPIMMPLIVMLAPAVDCVVSVGAAAPKQWFRVLLVSLSRTCISQAFDSDPTLRLSWEESCKRDCNAA
jgi:hypothetical protein